MYLKQAVIENSGSLQRLNLTLAFTAEGLPKPLILVGGNGGGKTNFLSTVADALFEAAAVHYDNVLPSRGLGRQWFRVAGGTSLTTGTLGSFSLLRFDDDGVSRFFKEKAGRIDPAEASTRVPSDFATQVSWSEDGTIKAFEIDDERSRVVFARGAYAYFPSSRSEVPYWLNRDAIPDVTFDTAPQFSKRLNKPIYNERALDNFKQWLLGVLTDARTAVYPEVVNGIVQWQLAGNPAYTLMSAAVLQFCNTLLQDIMSDTSLVFGWTGRKSRQKVAIIRQGNIVLPNLDALSAGQAILLAMFGTLLRYGDASEGSPNLNTALIEGICVIDEVDAHVHVELQYKILPKLIKMFPRIQFILSSHSPLFVLGMEKGFGADGIQVVEMPSGVPVGAESYAEFGKALEALEGSKAFTGRIIAHARGTGKPIVYVEGETDAPYIQRAAELRGKADLLERCDIEWIGSKDEKGQGFHTGKDALSHTLSVFRANPQLANRSILLLYDNDTNVPEEDFSGISVRRMPKNSKNTKVSAGIENLLSDDCIREEFYQTKETTKSNGDITIRKSLRKMEMCEEICSNGTAEQFSEFDKVLTIIEDYITLSGNYIN